MAAVVNHNNELSTPLHPAGGNSTSPADNTICQVAFRCIGTTIYNMPKNFVGHIYGAGASIGAIGAGLLGMAPLAGLCAVTFATGGFALFVIIPCMCVTEELFAEAVLAPAGEGCKLVGMGIVGLTVSLLGIVTLGILPPSEISK